MFRIVLQNGLNERSINTAGQTTTVVYILLSTNILLAIMNIFYEF